MPTWIAIIISPFIAAALGGLGWLLIWIGSVREHKSEVTKLMHEIRIDIKKILGRTRSKLMEGASPLTLNEKGRIVSEQIAATEWAEQVAKEFTDKIQGKEEFEIEQLAFDYVNDEYEPDRDMDRKMHRAAYNSAVPVWDVRAVLAIVLREALIDNLEG